MAATLLECSFLIPFRRDAGLSDGAEHERWLWKWLDGEMYRRFGGGTQAPGLYRGFYMDPDTKDKVADICLKFFVAVPEDQVDELRQLLQGACFLFQQKCIYLNVGGRVEFVKPDDE